MKPLKRLEALERQIRGWLPKDDATSVLPVPSSRRWTFTRWQFLSLFALESSFVFIALSVAQLIGWGAYPAAVAGAAGGGGALAGSLLFARLSKVSGLYAQIAGFEIQPPYLTHVIDWFGGLVVEGAASEADREVWLSRLAIIRKGDPISYSLITDRGRAISGNAVVKGVTTKVKPDGRLLFAITMRRE
ncbi:MAG: hypothetical protein ABSB29_05230 [Nitrososphaerales archaeon]|jgi:hypothetical protein